MVFPNSDDGVKGLPPIKFYGCCKPVFSDKNITNSNRPKCESVQDPTPNVPPEVGLNHKFFRLNRLSGPSQTWKVFKKQSDALNCAKIRKSGLMSFAFQQSTGERLFLVAHPQVFWQYDCRRIPRRRCTYEIIPEYSVCKLYFDLEYDIAYNPNCIGSKMVETFISVVCYYIKKVWGIECSRKHVLDLDSTTDTKFSRHLIFQLPNSVFRNNWHVGNFVNYVCNEIQTMCKKPCTKLSSTLEMAANMSILMVRDSKGKLKLFCDEAVYTRNRHFRLFHSTKHGKNAPLLLSPENTFVTDSNEDEAIFLNSLVTYVATESAANFKILEFSNTSKHTSNRSNDKVYPAILNDVPNPVQAANSPYPFIDNFVQELVSPGHIWRSAFFTTSDIIVYDIIGNRYCGNIRREHRSNNVKYIVDIKQCCYYQKCYDPDCLNYRSSTIKLSPELCFMLEDDSEFVDDLNLPNIEGDFDISDEDLLEVLNVVEDVSVIDFENDIL